MKRIGKVYLVGAGPGDPGLITVKGASLLKKADVILYDRLANPQLLNLAPCQAKKVCVGKGGVHSAVSQEQIQALMIREAKKGKILVRLKGGDPFVFGRGGEEALALYEAGIPFEIVPGVTSAIAVPAYAGIPLTHRDFTPEVAFVTGHENPQKKGAAWVNWEAVSQMRTIVLLMGRAHLKENCQRLIKAGKSPDTPAALISWGTYPYQKTLVGTLETLPILADQQKAQSPSVVVIGPVVSIREKLKWFDNKPLFGKRILVTRTRDQASHLTEELTQLGAEVIEFPTLEIRPLASAVLDRSLSQLSSYQWLLFTSVNAVDCFWEKLLQKGYSSKDLSHLKIAVIGPATAKRLKNHGLWVDLIPKTYQAEGLIQIFKKKLKKKSHILFPRAEEAREILPQALQAQGHQVDIIKIYKTEIPRGKSSELKRILKTYPPHWIPFASSSAVTNFITILGPKNIKKYLTDSKIACIGPVTQKTAVQFGLRVDLVPKKATISSLIEGLV